MKIVILKKFALARYDDPSPFPLGDLTIKIVGLPKYEGAEMRFIAQMNGLTVAKIALNEKSNTVTVEQSLLDCGEFKAAVVVYSKGIKIEEYAIEPLIITEVSGAFFAEPALAKLNGRLSAVEQTVLDTEKKFGETLAANAALQKTLNEELETVNKRLAALIKFAHDCISAIPYINELQLGEEV